MANKLLNSKHKQSLAWTHADMTGILRTIMVEGKPFNTEHKLYEYNHIKPKKQNKRGLGPDSNMTVCKETEELTKAGILQKVKHQTWVANPVMVKKSDGGWRMLVDKVFSHQIGRNLEAYVDNMVIKSTSEEEMLKDIQETFERFGSINMKLNPKKCSFGVEEGPFLGHLITKHGIKAKPSKVKAVTDLDQPRTLKDIQSLNGKLAALSQLLSKGAKQSIAFFKILKGCKDKKSIQWTTEADKALEKNKETHSKLTNTHCTKMGETLTMHLVASSRVLQGAELNYHALEKLVLALVHAIPFEDNEKKEKPKEVPNSSSKWRLYIDGASKSVGSGAGLMLIDLEGKEYTYALRFEFQTMNNEAEYKALLAGLQIAQEIDIAKVAIFLDSQLLLNQIKGTFAAKQASIKDYLQKVKNVLRGFKDYTVAHIRRNQNKKVDALSKLASMTFEHLIKEVLVEVLTKRLIEEKEVLKVDTQERKSWMNPIHECLLSGLLPKRSQEDQNPGAIIQANLRKPVQKILLHAMAPLRGLTTN
ncbi:reverse transcriptase domain-containing protein [Tanacetum coccineum]